MRNNGGRIVLAIDLGTGGPKAALVTLDGDLVGHTFEPTEVSVLPGGGAEQDPAAWWSAITTAVTRLVDQATGEVEPTDIAAVAVTGQWSGTVAVDEKGEPLAPAVIWMDDRGAPHIREVVGGRVNVLGYDPRKLQRWIRLTGGAPSLSGKDSIAHILFLKEERPDVYRAARWFLEPVDHLNQRLTGVAVSSYDCIVAHWLTDNRSRATVAYDAQLLEWCGIDRGTLPDLVPSASVVGGLVEAVADEWGLPPGIPVVTASGDVHSAVAGCGAVGDLDGHLYLGTSSWLSCHVAKRGTDLRHNMAALPSALPGRWFLANEHETAGGCLLHLRDRLNIVDDLEEANAVAATAPAGSHRLVYTPWLNGERTPVDDHTIRGGWTNLALAHDRSDLVRSVFEGVALNSRWLLDVVESYVKRPFPWLNVIGGGAQSDLWCQIHADVLDRPIRRVVDAQHAGARGAATIAAVALEAATPEACASKVRVEREFRPDRGNRPMYEDLYQAFRRLYKANKPIHARLNRA
ncbi:MAG: FGGY-family carbohydrate kinase [Actinobacteria bacterium]|nr:FGGY-family carbohydrate kinase [Actinomycetota bacterium]